MAVDKTAPMTKAEIAKLLQVPIEDIKRWAEPVLFGDWLDVCPEWGDRVHDTNDVLIFALISKLNDQVGPDIPCIERIQLIRQQLQSSTTASRIRERRREERERPEVARWNLVATNGVCSRYWYEWLKALPPSVNNIADFGCWASDARTATCSEPYALLWTLEATKVVVIDKEPQYIRNAQLWLDDTRQQHPYFQGYDLEFVVGDMTDTDPTEARDALHDESFDLSYCCNVLYNMYRSTKALQDAIDTMARVVKPGRWVIAVEPKVGVKYGKARDQFGGEGSTRVPLSEPKDISKYFEAAGLVKFRLDCAPGHSYCYQKPQG